MKEELELRMYGFVPYNISPIQQGIQFGHSVVEYTTRKNYLTGNSIHEAYSDWAENWKTFIILNGGTTNDNKDSKWYGSLNVIKDQLEENEIPFSYFEEPDLGDQLTAVTFICDERVFNYEDYPDFKQYFINEFKDMIELTKQSNLDRVEKDRQIKISKDAIKEIRFVDSSDYEKEYGKLYKIWTNQIMGNKKNVFLRNLLKSKKLA